MPIIEVPNHGMVEFPDGMSDAEIVAAIKRNAMGYKAQPAPKIDPTASMGIGERLAAGVGKSVADTGRGIGQLLRGVIASVEHQPRTISTLLTGKAQPSVADQIGLPTQEDVDYSNEIDKPLMATGAGMTGNIGGQIGQMVLPASAAMRGAKALGATKLLARGAAPAAVRAATGSAAFAGTQPVLSGESRLGNMAIGGAAGATGQGIASGVGALARPAAAALAPQVRALAARADQMGIPVSMTQLSDSKFLKTLSSTLERLPLTGAAQSRNAQQEAFNRAVSRTFGEDASAVTQDVYASAKQRIGGAFNSLTARNTLQIGDALLSKLASLQDEASRFGTDDAARAVGSAVDELLAKADASGKLPGRAYQALDSKLGKLTKAGDEKAMYLGQVRDAVREAMDGSISAADREAWQLARGQYKNLKTVRDLVAKEGADGNISPALLAGRMNATQAGKEAMAMGKGGDLGDLARIGRQFVRDPIPDSGTAGRLTALGALTGGGYAMGIDPQATLLTLAGGATGGRALNKLLNSQAGRNYMLNGSSSAKTLAELLRPLPYGAAPLALDANR